MMDVQQERAENRLSRLGGTIDGRMGVTIEEDLPSIDDVSSTHEHEAMQSLCFP